MTYLNEVHNLKLKNYCIGAGSIRDTVWSYLHGIDTVKYKDIDVAYYDENESRDKEKEYERYLTSLAYGVEWDVKNQALVHEWYQQKFNIVVDKYRDLTHAISTWPETATSVAVFLDSNNNMQVIAPFGLDDLFNITLRRNKTRVTKEIFEQRLRSKRLEQKWAKLRVVRD